MNGVRKMIDLKTLSISNLFAELNAREEVLNEAHRAESIAGNARCAATNSLNEVQKEIDVRLAKLKELAPSDSNWHASRRKGRSIEVTTS